MNNKKITSRDVDYAKWYTDVITASKLANYSNVKGCIVIEPNGYAIWEKMQSVLDKMFKDTGHKNVSLPMLIPESLMKKESDLIKGFAPEVAWVTHGGEKELEERMCIRPTSETLFSDYYSGVVLSYKDLPLKYNQWCSVLRWEKETRPFLRSREFLWQEGHTVHETKEEAQKETLDMLNVYKTFFEEYLAIPVITGLKTEKEKFAGAEYTYTIEALMYNGICLQSGTSHYFGQRFSKAYDIKFSTKENKEEYAYQTSWGVSTRMIGGLIMVHSDDFGLVLPPKIAPTQVVIVTIDNSEEVKDLAEYYCQELNNNKISSYIDDRDKSAGYKFADSEVNGIPVRIEIGSRDLINNSITIVRRDTREKMIENKEIDVVSFVSDLLNAIQNSMYEKALKRRNELTYEVNTIEEVKKIMETKPGFIKTFWCESAECEAKMKEIRGTKSRCIVENINNKSGECIVCGKSSKTLVIWGIQY